MPRPRFCSNLACSYAHSPPPKWFVRDGVYHTVAHGVVQRYRCRGCRRRLSRQTESIYYYSKRRLDLRQIFSRLRGGSSMRDIGRELGCSRTAIANAVLRLGRQSMAAHLAILPGVQHSGRLCFDGLLSAVTSRDYPSQITTLGDSKQELLLAMTQCVTERGGNRTLEQQARIAKKRAKWRPSAGTLTASISLLINELSRFAGPLRLHIDTDEHPIYATLITRDLALRWYQRAGLLTVGRTPGSAPRTPTNPLSFVNYLDRMIRHRLKEHTRESIAIARNATMQMHRMWIFAWDHNACQPRRVAGSERRSRAELAGVHPTLLWRIHREFFARRFSLKGLPAPRSIQLVWTGCLESPPVRWRVAQKHSGPHITAYAIQDLSRAYLHAQ